jgi:sigma-B regulation protein RsbU (phosphoserine phosphatase)
LFLTDVSGKGMSAALLGASLHAAVRSNALAGVGCGEVLAKVNSLIFETTAPERFATVFFAVYDPATKKLTYANAGHCPPILMRGKECRQLKSLTPPLGILRTIPAVEGTVELCPGDWLLIFSDGIPEASDAQEEEFGEQRLVEALIRYRGRTAAEACAAIVARCGITFANGVSRMTSRS